MRFRSPPSPDYLPFEQGPWRGWVHKSWQEASRNFDLDQWQKHPHEVVRDRPTTKTSRMTVSGTDIYLKHIAGLKDSDPQSRSLINKTRNLLYPSRSLKTLQIHCQLNQAGFPTSTIFLAATLFTNGQRGEILISEAIHAPMLCILLENQNCPQDTSTILKKTGSVLAKLHLAGFTHGDFGPGNVIAQNNTLILLDNEKTKHRFFTSHFWVRKRNLEQMLHRLRPLLTWHHAKFFLDGYFASWNQAPWKTRHQRYQIAIKLRKRHQYRLQRTHNTSQAP